MNKPLQYLLLFLTTSFSFTAHAQYVYTVAGGGKSTEGIPALEASVTPNGVAVDAEGNVYFIDLKHHAVRVYDASTGKVNTIAGGSEPGFSGDSGPAIGAALNDPRGIALIGDGKRLYIADKGNNRIRMVDITTGTITTVAGSGIAGYAGDGDPATEARLSVVGVHRSLYLADSENNIVKTRRQMKNLLYLPFGLIIPL